MRRGALAAVAAALALVGCGGASGTADTSAQPAAPGAAALSITPFVTGLEAPLHVAATRSEPGRLYVVEQAGRIRVVENGRLRAEPFLDIRPLVRSGGEQGLLSVAFHPAYASNRRFYVNYTDRDGDTNVVEYRSDGTTALPGTARRLLRIDQPYENHNGGQLAFAPDGRLWVGMGDGGAAGDPQNRAQNMRSRLGKLLSINVATGKVRIEALGVRNPWRFSFDRRTGDRWIGDVGQNAWEEIDFLPRRSPGLENFGWDAWEGRARYEPKPISRGRLIRPTAVYSHGVGCSVTGGFVYRGTAVPAARGRYFYGDFCSGIVWSLKRGAKPLLRREGFKVENLSSFGEDAAGELYLASLNGTVYRLGR
ncbi:MAG: PQQ-dependent sugar dehydrogenase [Pseudomonadota bacterium]